MKTFREFQEQARRTGGAGDDGPLAPRLSLVGLGLTGEAGEVADIIKKVIHHGRAFDDAMRAKLIEELGDVLWYIAHAANVLGVEMDDVVAANNAKLAKRYPNGFNTADSIARRDERE